MDVGDLPNHVKYCVSVLSLQWANIRTSPVEIPWLLSGVHECWGNSDRWCTDNCSTKSKHTDIIFNVVRQIAYIHGRESILFRDRERIQHMEEDHIHSTPISHCCIGQQLHKAAGLLVAALLFLSLFTLSTFSQLSHFALFLGAYL